MNNAIKVFLAALLAGGCATSRPPAEVDLWEMTNYEVSCDMIGTEGVQTMVVASFGKDAGDALARARWDAVHAILFKGLQTDVCKAPPLVDYEAYRHSTGWFKAFFGPSQGYLSFITAASDVPLDLVYVRGGVKVFSQVAVNRNGLRKRLVEAGVIANMGDVFERQ